MMKNPPLNLKSSHPRQNGEREKKEEEEEGEGKERRGRGRRKALEMMQGKRTLYIVIGNENQPSTDGKIS